MWNSKRCGCAGISSPEQVSALGRQTSTQLQPCLSCTFSAITLDQMICIQAKSEDKVQWAHFGSTGAGNLTSSSRHFHLNLCGQVWTWQTKSETQKQIQSHKENSPFADKYRKTEREVKMQTSRQLTSVTAAPVEDVSEPLCRLFLRGSSSSDNSLGLARTLWTSEQKKTVFSLKCEHEIVKFQIWLAWLYWSKRSLLVWISQFFPADKNKQRKCLTFLCEFNMWNEDVWRQTTMDDEQPTFAPAKRQMLILTDSLNKVSSLWVQHQDPVVFLVSNQ